MRRTLIILVLAVAWGAWATKSDYEVTKKNQEPTATYTVEMPVYKVAPVASGSP